MKLDTEPTILAACILIYFIGAEFVRLLVRSVYSKLTGKHYVLLEVYEKDKEEFLKQIQLNEEYVLKHDCKKGMDRLEQNAKSSEKEVHKTLKDLKVLVMIVAQKIGVPPEELKSLID